jgi:hypothetical protein
MDPKTLRKYYDSVHINSTTYFDNALSLNRLEVEEEWSALSKPVDRDQWDMTVPTVNAYYNPPGNEIVFPAGIMQVSTDQPNPPLPSSSPPNPSPNTHPPTVPRLLRLPDRPTVSLLRRLRLRLRPRTLPRLRQHRPPLRSERKLHRLVDQRHGTRLHHPRRMFRQAIRQLHRPWSRRQRPSPRQRSLDTRRKHSRRRRIKREFPGVEGPISAIIFTI